MVAGAFLFAKSIPRVSGGEPTVQDGGEADVTYSPRERG